MTDATGILVMAYGTPKDLDGVEAYYTDIRRGRPPTPELLEELKERYRAIGGRSPLLDITLRQAAGIQERLQLPAYVGLKHASPFIADAVERLTAEGSDRIVGLVLAPHYSAMSVGDYESRARAALDALGWEGTLHVIPNWHLEPDYIDLLAERVRAVARDLPADATVLFTAHSLPERILRSGDPYADQLRETAAAVAGRASLKNWDVAWQSAGRTEDPWLGPDILDVLPKLHADGVEGVVICPCGFVADHLEVLYDIDIEARAAAEELGMKLLRTESPNTDPDFLDALAAVVRKAL